MGDVRIWLLANKIFFETLAASALALAAIIVAVVQTWIAKRQSDLTDRQTSLANLQTRIAEAQAMPTFDTRVVQVRDQTTQKVDHIFLAINSSGGPVQEFNARTVFIVQIKGAANSKPISNTEIKFRVSDYFAVSEVSAATTGRLVTKVGVNNNRVLSDFANALREEANLRGWMYAIVDEIIYLRVDYRDILGRSHRNYYDVAPVGGARKIPDDKGREVFDSTFEQVYLSDLTADAVVPRLEEQLRGQPRYKKK